MVNVGVLVWIVVVLLFVVSARHAIAMVIDTAIIVVMRFIQLFSWPTLEISRKMACACAGHFVG